MGFQGEGRHLTNIYNFLDTLPSVKDGLAALGVLAERAHIEFDMTPKDKYQSKSKISLRSNMVLFQSIVLPIVIYPSIAMKASPLFLESGCDSCCGDRVWKNTISVLKSLYEDDYPEVAEALDCIAVIIENEAEWKRRVREVCTPEIVDELFTMTDIYLSRSPKIIPFWKGLSP